MRPRRSSRASGGEVPVIALPGKAPGDEFRKSQQSRRVG